MKRISKQVTAGGVKIGGGAPVTVQSMLNVPSTDIEGSVRQAVALEKAGCQILRAAIPDMDAVRLIPAIGKKVGDELNFGGLLGSGPVMDVNMKSPSVFVNRGGRIPAPLQSLKN